MNKNAFKDMDKILELESIYRQQQLDALTWKPVAKAPVSTGLGYTGYIDDLGVFKPAYTYEEQYNDVKKMFENQLRIANYYRYGCIGRIPTIFVDMRLVIESMFGVETNSGAKSTEEFWSKPLDIDLKEIVELGLPPLTAGDFLKYRQYHEYFVENMPEGFKIHMSGILSPFGTALAIIGSRIFSEVYDRPELVLQFLDIITVTHIQTQKELFKISGLKNPREFYYFGACMPGGLMVAGDDLVNISPEMIQKFELPFLKKISESLGCKLFYHYCPHPKDTPSHYTDHIFKELIKTDYIIGLNSQPMGYWAYQDYYDDLKSKKFGIQSGVEFPEDCSGSEFYKSIEKLHENTYKKSGIHITLREIKTPGQTRQFMNIWNNLE